MSTTYPQSRSFWFTLLIVLALAAFIVTFVMADTTYIKFADAHFPNVGTSAWLATLWGLISRAYLLILIIPVILWKPRLFGFRIGKARQHWRMLLIMLVANCSVIGGYLLLTGSTTPTVVTNGW